MLLCFALAFQVLRTPPAHAEAAPVPELERAEALFREGRTQDALRVLQAAMDTAAQEADPAMDFRLLIRWLLYENRVPEAQTRLLAMMRMDPEATAPALRDMIAHLRRQAGPAGRPEGGETAEALLRMGVPDAVLGDAVLWRLETLIGLDAPDALSGLARQLIDNLPPERVLAVAERVFERMSAMDLIAAADFMIKPLLELPATPQRDAVLNDLHVAMAKDRRQWMAGEDDWKTAVDRLPDGRLAALIEVLWEGAGEEPEVWQLLDALCERALRIRTGEPLTAQIAARVWLDEARRSRRYRLIPRRIRSMRGWNVLDEIVFEQYARLYYETVLSDPQALDQMLALGEQLLEEKEKQQQETLKEMDPLPLDSPDAMDALSGLSRLHLLVIDALFLKEAYDRAIERVEYTVPLMTEDWHKLSLSKLMAHKSVADGRPLDAVEHFRAFVDGLRGGIMDPSTGIEHTREMLRGRNLRRIGDLLRQAGRENEARKAFDEARAYYSETIERLDVESETSKLSIRERDAIPGGPES